MLRPKPRHRSAAPTLRDQQKAETQRRILDAARRLFTEQGYDAVSTAMIGQQAGVSAPSIMQHFGSKAGLLYAILTEHNDGQLDAARSAAARARTSFGRIERIIATWAAADLATPALTGAMQAILWSSTEAAQRNRADIAPDLAFLQEVIEAGQQRGELRAMAPERATAIAWQLYTMGLMPGVHDGAGAEACTQEIMANIRAALAA